MGGNKNKNAGSAWERWISNEFNKEFGDGVARRIPGSGALGTQLRLNSLRGDVQLDFPFLSKKIVVEAKIGYGSKDSLRVQRDWLKSARKDAEPLNAWPMLFAKFKGAHGKEKYFVILDGHTVMEILKDIEALNRELLEYQNKESA